MDTLFFIGLFAFSLICISYKYYALQNSWPIGEILNNDNFWVRELGLFGLLASPIAGLIIGPWWTAPLVVVVGFVTAFILTITLKKHVQVMAILGLILFWLFSGIVFFSGKGHAEKLEAGHDSIPEWVNKMDPAIRKIWEVLEQRGLYFVNKRTFDRLSGTIFYEYSKNEKTIDPNLPPAGQIQLIIDLTEKLLDRELNQVIGPSFQCEPHRYSDGATHLDCW